LIARDALDLVSSGAIGRVRHCADPTCRALFYDGSRPGCGLVLDGRLRQPGEEGHLRSKS